MADILDKATASPPPMLGQGCLQRYDLERLPSGAGAAFEDAARLWQAMLDEAARVEDEAGEVSPEAGESKKPKAARASSLLQKRCTP
ncbi:hypothetical protein [Stutzerimonas azotifigens]|uniref:hypothetical protein n=1 Tax=Stutzerimonas azotifigens TaxID=291995 RepID=UPI000406E9E5|nr:hypothetical protein [Stutzerimonas azotifigens]